MTRTLRTAAIATVLLLFAAFASGAPATPSPSPTLAPDAPPAGLHASTSNVAAVLAAWHTANGPPTKKPATQVVVDAISAFGLTGTDRVVSVGDDYRVTRVLGIITTQFGRYHGQRWTRNENGILINEAGIHKRDQVDSQVLGASVNAPSKDVVLAGEVDAPVAAYVLKVNPPGGRLEWLLIDRKTSLLDSEIDAYPQLRLTTTYDDYRRVNGVMRAWHKHVSDGRPLNDEDYRVSSYEVNIPVSDRDVKIPDSGASIVTFPPDVTSVRLPASVSRHGEIIVRLTVNGRGLDFILDSGASGIVMDSEVAKELGVKTFGKSIQTTAGPYEATQAVIPEIDIGTITLHNTYVECLPFSQQLNYGTRVVGLLGFDFIANAVVSIDYDHGIVTASPPLKFTPPTSGIVLAATLDGGVPYVQAQLGNAVGDHFILDTGSSFVVVFSSFADAHPDDVADEGLGRNINAIFPYLSGSGVGGEIPMTVTQVAAYHFSTVNFTDFLVFRTHGHTAFEGEDDDGLVGFDALRFFTVILDYKDATIYLQPGSYLEKLKATPARSPHP